MNTKVSYIKQRLSLREPLAEALEVMATLVDKLDLKEAKTTCEYEEYLKRQLEIIRTKCSQCKDFGRAFPSFAFSIATGIGKTRLMGACIAYLYLTKGIRHFMVLAPNLTLYEKMIRDFGEPSYEKYVFKGISEFVHNRPVIVNGDNYNQLANNLFSDTDIQINLFNISKFNSDSKEGKKGAPKMRRLSEYLGQSYFEYLSELNDLVILMDEAHRYHADASKKAINELKPILGLEMTATPIDEKGKSFKNIVYEYNLAQALKDGKYVKIPTVAKRRNFERGEMSDEELDIIKLEDALSIHEHTKVQLAQYAKEHDVALVKPFVLVVCKNIQHATETYDLIENELYGGRYKGKVLQIDSSTKKDEEIENQFISLEKPDNDIEIVIHVNMLKEGWDVTNLYTIVPLRAADAPVLVEQQIGRGLRLPYGKRTGVKNIDKLTVIAHENFEAVIAKANDPNSVLSKVSYVELDENDLNMQLKLEPIKTKLDIEEECAKYHAKTDEEKQKVEVVSDVKRMVYSEIPKMNNLVSNINELKNEDHIKILKERVKEHIESKVYSENNLFANEVIASKVKELDDVIQITLQSYIDNMIEIPRITIMKHICEAEFEWFDLDVSEGYDLKALEDSIIRKSIGVGEHYDDVIKVETGRKYLNPNNQIVNCLIDYDEIDYDENSELLFHLAGQAVAAIQSHIGNTDDIAKVVNQYEKEIARNIYLQMKEHFKLHSLGFEKPKVLPFVGIRSYGPRETDNRMDYRSEVKPKQVQKTLFYGFHKSYFAEYTFDSKTELDFAYVLEMDDDVLKWLRPAPNQFNIYWGNNSHQYEPDFIVETSDCVYMIEIKAVKDMKDEGVLEKKASAEEYCKIASEYTINHGGKRWEYRMIRHDDVAITSNFNRMISF